MQLSPQDVVKMALKLIANAVITSILLNLSGEQSTQASVVLVPLGSVNQSKVAAVARRLSETFNANVSIARRETLPKLTYYAPRKRYRADKLLTWLGKRYPESYVMGITSSDN